MSSCPNTLSSKPRLAFPVAGQASTRWRRWATAVVLTLPALASAAPLLRVSSGSFQAGGCLAGQTETAVSDPLSHSQHCSQELLRTADAFATADFGRLGVSGVFASASLLLIGIALAAVARRRAARAVNLWAPALVCALALPLQATAAPVLTTTFGPFGIGTSTCLQGVTRTAAVGPLVDQQSCSRNVLGTQSATALASADFGSLGASTVLTMAPFRLNTPSITGSTLARFEAEYLFSGPGTSVPVQLNLDLDGLLSVSGQRSSAFMQVVLNVSGQAQRTARIEIRDNGLVLTDTSLDADIDFSSLLGLAGGGVEIDSDTFSVPVGVPVTFRLSLTTGGALGSSGAGGVLNSTSDFDSTLTFNRDGPVFSMPVGFTVNGPGVVDNQWIGADAGGGTVPEPGTLLLAGLGLCLGLGLRATAARSPPLGNSLHAA